MAEEKLVAIVASANPEDYELLHTALKNIPSVKLIKESHTQEEVKQFIEKLVKEGAKNGELFIVRVFLASDLPISDDINTIMLDCFFGGLADLARTLSVDLEGYHISPINNAPFPLNDYRTPRGGNTVRTFHVVSPAKATDNDRNTLCNDLCTEPYFQTIIVVPGHPVPSARPPSLSPGSRCMLSYLWPASCFWRLIITFIGAPTIVVIAIALIFPGDWVGGHLKSLNERGEYHRVLSYSHYKDVFRGDLWMPGEFLTRVDVETAKAQLGKKNVEKAYEVLNNAKEPNPVWTIYDEFFLTKVRTILEKGKRTPHQSAKDSEQNLVEARETFQRVDEPEKLGNVGIQLWMELENAWAEFYSEQQNVAQAETSFKSVLTRPSKIRVGLLDEYIKALVGKTRLQQTRGDPVETRETIGRLRFAYDLASDHGLKLRCAQIARNIGISFRDYVIDDPSALGTAEHEFEICLRHCADIANSDKAWSEDDRFQAKKLETECKVDMARLKLVSGRANNAKLLLDDVRKENSADGVMMDIELALAQYFMLCQRKELLPQARTHITIATKLIDDNGARQESLPDILLWTGHLEYCDGNIEQAKALYKESIEKYKAFSQTGKPAYKEANEGLLGKPPPFLRATDANAAKQPGVKASK